MRAIIPAMIGSTWFALDALAVQEVIGRRTWIRLPFASPRTPGVLSWRGRAVTVLEVGDLLAGGHAQRDPGPTPRTLVAQAGACTLAIPVDVVREVHDVAPGQVHPATERRPHVSEEVSLLDGVMPLLDLASIVELALREEATLP